MCLRTCLRCSSFLMQAMISGLLTFPWNLSRGYGYINIHMHKYVCTHTHARTRARTHTHCLHLVTLALI